MRSYNDEQLAGAIRDSRSWRGVLRALGLKGDSAGSMRAARRRADQLAISYSHFTGQRRWSDGDLSAAVRAGSSWSQVALALGLASTSGATLANVRSHAFRLGLATGHLEPRRVPPRDDADVAPSTRHLSRAGSLLAAAWFELCGHAVSWPLEPCRYDLIVWRNGRADRIQVKTTTRRSGATWTVQLRTNRKESHVYTSDEIDQFFIVAGDYACYLIPLKVVAGFGTINLSAYGDYQVPGFTAPASSCPPPRTHLPGSSSGR
ncbi:group I intron-associated PD-(D/E)XK endonuclease [Nocardioides marmorisolisilvae]|uniref:group I intron-associated PD-(D/E)XK endonuclease n=1 Tax=Nocardioides marmorisolisilvae TaxID=1542737 RepID=UPI0011CE7BD2|nr:group I intron-associated PD-(D/E)XK endonuclease [Nocardioides marmorisolisilvae]